MQSRLACADFTFPLLAHTQVFQLIGMLGFEGVDIGLFEGRSHLWPSQAFGDPASNGHHLHHQLETNGLVAADIFLQLDPDFTPYAINQPDPTRRNHAREAFLRMLDYAKHAGARHVTTLPGVVFTEESEVDSWHRAVAELQWRVEQAKAHGLVFGVEPHVGSITSSPEAALALIGAVPGLTLTLDYTHFTRLGLADTAIEPLVAHASHFHVRGACKGRLQAPFKDNTIDYDRVLTQMSATGYAGWLGIEYVWIDWERCNECDNLSETILFRDYVRRVLHQLAALDQP